MSDMGINAKIQGSTLAREFRLEELHYENLARIASLKRGIVIAQDVIKDKEEAIKSNEQEIARLETEVEKYKEE